MINGYIPKDQRKKILLLSDDLRMPSGIGVMSREIVMGTAHHFNWVQLGAAVQHPEFGKALDMSETLNKDLGLTDSYLHIYPYNGYGDAQVLRQIINIEKPDAILHFTDPRYWIWLYQMEHELREHFPLLFYHIWDSTPYPKYNENYYRSCDWISCISKQTYNIVKQVWKKGDPKPWQVKYIPHGVNSTHFYKPSSDTDLQRVADIRKKLFGDDKVDFVVMYNSRNLRRKSTSDIVLGYREFLLSIPEEQRASCRLLLHTQPVDDNGTDLPVVLRDVAPEVKAVFSADRVDTPTLNHIYSVADVVINMSSNEGFGLGIMEAMMAERMVIVNVTGGLQDQCGFINDQGEYLHEDREFCEEWGSNADGRYRECGEWGIPLFPTNRSLIGSPPTPYIFDDRCSYQDAGKAIRQIYDMTPEERARRGALGRKYAVENGFSANAMAQGFIDGINNVFQNWKPRRRFELVKA